MNQVVRQDPRVKSVRDLLNQLKPQMASALPAHLSAERMARIAMTQVQNNPYLLECDRGSLLASVMTACQLGLEPDGILGHGYLVPFKRKVQFIPGYKGYIKLARQSGEIADLYAEDVRANDTFKIVHGLHRDLQHVKAEGDRGEVTGFYAVAKYVNGGFDFKHMTVAEVNEIRDKSEGYKAFVAGKIKDTPWVNSYVAMGMKTVIRQLAKFLPMSVQRAAAIEEQHDAGKHVIIEHDDLVISNDMIDEQVTAKVEEKPKAAAKLDKFAKKDEPKAEEPPAEKPEPVFEEGDK
jgi:recombination protein RecT